MSTANGVVYAGSLASVGTDMYSLDAATGTILRSFASGGSVTGGASIAGGSVYWGSGYCGTACLGSARRILTEMLAGQNRLLAELRESLAEPA